MHRKVMDGLHKASYMLRVYLIIEWHWYRIKIIKYREHPTVDRALIYVLIE